MNNNNIMVSVYMMIVYMNNMVMFLPDDMEMGSWTDFPPEISVARDILSDLVYDL